MASAGYLQDFSDSEANLADYLSQIVAKGAAANKRNAQTMQEAHVEAGADAPQSGALTGGAIGSMFSPIGAAIGAGLGAIAGIAKDTATRTAQPGTSFLGSLGSALTDVVNPKNFYNAVMAPGAVQNMAAIAGSIKKSAGPSVTTSLSMPSAAADATSMGAGLGSRGTPAPAEFSTGKLPMAAIGGGSVPPSGFGSPGYGPTGPTPTPSGDLPYTIGTSPIDSSNYLDKKLRRGY